MKKLGVYILLFTIIANLFAPLSIQKNNQIRLKTAEAAVFSSADAEIAQKAKDECLGTIKRDVCASGRYITVGSKLQVNVYVIGVDLNGDDRYSIKLIQAKNTDTGKDISIPVNFAMEDIAEGDFKNKIQDDSDNYDAVLFYSGDISGLEENSNYLFSFEIVHDTFAIAKKTTIQELKIVTGGAQKVNSQANEATSSADSIMPACQIVGSSGTFMGCLVQAFYYIFFVSTSFVFALAGKLFDFAFHYSIQDTSYRLGFVTEGWKIVRDLCNMFFIFLLLSAAIKMILNIGHGEKSTIVKVIIIGLLINFSLFTTHIVIDASNILARLFYNSDAINVVVNGNEDVNGVGSVSSYVYGGDGQLPLSAALIDKVDPQAIILGAKNINSQAIDNGRVRNPNAAEMAQSNQGIGVGAFFLVTLLAVIVNLIGIFVFISVAFIFIGRVVGLWFSMIFVPLAFFSYAAPNLPEGLSRFGWKSWWSELIGTAFVAPVFMFMIYLILLFLSKGFMDIFDGDSYGAEFVLKTMVPFIVIMILLMKSKDVASDMSKGVASAATTGLKVAGGAALALGGAGVGVVGRNVIGKTFAKASNGTTSTQKYEAAKAALTTAGGRDPSLYNALSRKEKILGNIGSKMQLGKVFGKSQVTAAVDERGRRIANTASVGGVQGGIGGAINKSQKKVGDIVHANHEYEEIAKALHIDPKIPYKDLGAVDKAAVDKKFRDSKRSDAENNIKKGLVAGVQGENDYIKDPGNLARATTEYREDRRREIEQDFLLKNNATSVAGLSADKQDALTAKLAAPLTESDNNKIKNKLGTEYKETVLKQQTDHKLDHDLDHMAKGSAEKISFKDRIASDSTRGTYNPLNISKLSAIKNDALTTQLIFGITSAVALGMRSGLKNQASVNMGSGSLKFTEDMKNLFSDAIKGANIKLESPGGGGGHGGGHDDHGHGGGHDDHGHGGH